MSLTRAERDRTRQELHANLALTGLTSEDLAEALGWDVAHADAALAVMGTDPRDVWLVRDYLEREITSAGGMPRPYSSLTERMRRDAERWFGLYDVEEIISDTNR